MNLRIAIVFVAALFAAAGCHRSDERAAGTGSSAARAERTPPPSQTQNTPAQLPKPTDAEKQRESDHPQQEQVDTKEPSQRRDFQRR